MDPRRWQRLNDLFHDAVGRVPGERQAWIVNACAGDEELAGELERLVRAHEQAGSLIDTASAKTTRRFETTPSGSPIGPQFSGSERFVLRRVLGLGGMGVVYEAYDRARGEVVALKTLLRAEPAEIYRLKREFRSLADVAHQNLVALYELFVEGELGFFTMELVNGRNFVEAIRRTGAADATDDSERPLPKSVDADRLRLLLSQLVSGLEHLHRHRKLHRDIKPSNVLVTPEDRVVILDFGLIAEMMAPVTGQDERIVGTPAYMSPEQSTGASASEASDWYAVGATLYEALTGRLPFAGSVSDILRCKLELDPPSPSDVAPGVGEDLDAVCMGLLCRDPSRRLSGRDAIARIGGHRVETLGSLGSSLATETTFVGRDRHLKVLRDSFDETRGGRTKSVYVCGQSGIGKSALVRTFLDRLRVSDGVVILSGRCYESESVPYKALDGIVDSLGHYLASQPPALIDRLIPPDVSALTRLFPVLDRMAGVVSSAVSPEADPVQVRRRGFAALRELLSRMAAIRPVIIFIDDLHWADVDSAVLLDELLRPPASPPVLLLACLRTEEIAAKPFLSALLEERTNAISLPLSPLSDDEARTLVASVLPTNESVGAADTTRIVREAEGSPFFIEQLAQYIHAHRGHAPTEEPTLAEMLDVRLHDLAPGAREFLETLSICGRPMDSVLVRDACGLTGDERPLVRMLRSAHLIRSSGSGDRIEMYHDRIRQALTSRVDVHAARRVHLRLAHALVTRGIDDPEALFEHYRAAGEQQRASVQAAQAADKAAQALAFDRAAEFYRHALAQASDEEPHVAWRERLATALANAGRPTDSAQAYLEAAAYANVSNRRELQRRGADQFLIGGHIDRGIGVMRTVLEAEGLSFPKSARGAFASLLVRRGQLRWRGSRFVERPANAIPLEALSRIDTCWSVTTGIAMVDIVRALDFQTRHLLLALDAGDPYRIARGLAAEAAFYATRGGSARQQSAAHERLASEISERVGHPHAIAFTKFMSGLSAISFGEWKKASKILDQALTLFRNTCVGVTWELSNAHTFLVGSFLYQGEFREAEARLGDAIETARQRGNLYHEAELRTRVYTLLLLVADKPDEAERQTHEVMRRWGSSGFSRQHYSHLLGCTITALYRGDGDHAWRLIVENDRALKRNLLTSIQLVRIETAFLRGRCALAALTADRATPLADVERQRFVSIAQREARRISLERMPWSDGFSRLLDAAVAYQNGGVELAEQRLAEAADAFDRVDMKLYWAGARRRLGLLQGERGRDLVQSAEAWMASQSIRNPLAMTRMVAPGFPDA
jgi:serine/threonine protein kinase/tetratricopeptide (TPR) repeat protein